MKKKKQRLHSYLSFWLVQNLSKRWRFWVRCAYQNDDVQTGQALVTLLFFMIIAITITSAAVVIILTNSMSAQKLEQGTTSYYAAESGAENALLRLLRDPNYPGEPLTIDGATVTTAVAKSGSIYTITSNSTSGNFKRTVQVTTSFVNNIFTISSWKEIF